MIQGMLEKSGALWQCKDFEELTVPELYELLRCGQKFSWWSRTAPIRILTIRIRPPATSDASRSAGWQGICA